jgi:polysaccharide biosynthesis/export protein
VAKAGGLLDQRADPRGVFLFRFEPRSLVADLGANPASTGSDEMIPVVYELDLSKAGSYFLAQNFAMRDHDIIYIANARTTTLQKFLDLLGAIVSPALSGATVDAYVR